MNSYNEHIRWAVALSFLEGLGPISMQRLAQSIHDDLPSLHSLPLSAAVLAAGRTHSMVRIPLKGWSELLHKADLALTMAERHCIQVIWHEDSSFPIRIRRDRMPDGPLVLYVKGDATCLHSARSLAVVGTRKPTAYGMAVTDLWVEALAPAQPTLVSGLAFGIDSAAHRAALRWGLPTVAVLAHGLHTIQPQAHYRLADSILQEGGCWVSELPWGVDPESGRFPQRNRLIAALGDAVFIPEAGCHSGTLITARMAMDYNKPVYAVPGRIDDAMSEGCLALLTSEKSQMAFRPAQFLEDMQWNGATPESVLATAPNGCALAILEALKTMEAKRKRAGPLSFKREYVHRLCPGWAKSQINHSLRYLETQGQVKYNAELDIYSSSSASFSAEAMSPSTASSSEDSSSSPTKASVGVVAASASRSPR